MTILDQTLPSTAHPTEAFLPFAGMSRVPAHLSPLQLPAFLARLRQVVADQTSQRQFTRDTGWSLGTLNRTGWTFDAPREDPRPSVHSAGTAGYERLVAITFVDWATKNHWGEREDARLAPGTRVRFKRDFHALLDAARTEFIAVGKWRTGAIIREHGPSYLVCLDGYKREFPAGESEFEPIPVVCPPPASSPLVIGTRIRFLRLLGEDATGDHPALEYARRGETGEITGHGTQESYWAKTDHWPASFGLAPGEFEVL